MNRERLQMAIDIIEAIPDSKIRLAQWVYCGDYEALMHPTPDNQCGTVACAAGWLALSPAFRNMGLRLDEIEYSYRNPDRIDEARLFLQDAGSSVLFTGWDALAHIFGLSALEAYHLFNNVTAYERQNADSIDGTLSDRQIWLERARTKLYSG